MNTYTKDSLIRMFNGTIKMVQDIQIGDKLMGDDNSPRIVQELFRGTDTMVKIIPKKEKSFIVNINHGKFNNVGSTTLNRRIYRIIRIVIATFFVFCFVI